ncbi:hypothetical protein L7F22_006526 [Adiantum nelumboides]|nr:hypothetical protein [Adiantum nelumboides]
MCVEVPQIKDDEILVIQTDFKDRLQWEPLSGVILNGGAGVNIIGQYMKERMGIINPKSASFDVKMVDQRIMQPIGLLENLYIKPAGGGRPRCGPSAFTFHLHNIAYNPSVNNADNFTSVYGLPANVSNWPNPYAFSTTSTSEDPITSGPSVSSQQIGVANGFWHLTSKVGYTLFHIFTANITQGDHIGTILREADAVRDMTVIGGTGAFLGARGLASCRLVTIDRTPPACWTLSFDLDLYY